MAETKYRPEAHDHAAFLKKARKRRDFSAAYKALAVEYFVANERLAACARSGLAQEAVASPIGTTGLTQAEVAAQVDTTHSPTARLESPSGTRSPFVATSRRGRR